MTGKLRVTVRGLGSSRVYTLETQNHVTLLGVLQMLKIFAGDSALTRTVSRIQVGTGTTVARHSDTALEIPILPIIVPLEVIHDPTTFSVVIRGSLLQDEGNGLTIAEAGLLSEDGVLIARSTFTPTLKTSSEQFDFQWKLQA